MKQLLSTHIPMIDSFLSFNNEINHSHAKLSISKNASFTSQSKIALFKKASTYASTFHVRTIWVQNENDSFAMQDFITTELINQPMKYSVTE